jgi:hypothetical protein
VRRLTARGRMVVAAAIIVPAFLATCALIFNPL